MIQEAATVKYENLTPKQIVAELDQYIVGQDKAKRAVAIALRNRYRRSQLPPELQDEIVPKNIIMIGPTGVGKTEVARRLAKLVGAPFVKVEATKFTEVGYVGRDVESIVRDLVEASIRIVRNERIATVSDRAQALAKERLLDVLHPRPRSGHHVTNPLGALFGMATPPPEKPESSEEEASYRAKREDLRRQLDLGALDDQIVEIEVEENKPQFLEVFSGTGVEEMGFNLQDVFGHLMPRKTRRRKVSVAQALKIFEQEEAQKLIDHDEVATEAVARAEQSGIVFIDEIDKIAGSGSGSGPDVSREGVQRDILPIVEGSTVTTKYGPVRTDHILFIAAGAFHVAKPSDLIPELQGRFPIRVEFESLSRDDFVRILSEPQNALLKQYAALLKTEGIDIHFTPDGIDQIARIAQEINAQTEDIGARRLHTILERLLEEVSYEGPDLAGQTVTIDQQYVQDRLSDVMVDRDLSHYIL